MNENDPLRRVVFSDSGENSEKYGKILKKPLQIAKECGTIMKCMDEKPCVPSQTPFFHEI